MFIFESLGIWYDRTIRNEGETRGRNNERSKRERKAERKEVEKEHVNLANENIFNVGPLDGDIM